MRVEVVLLILRAVSALALLVFLLLVFGTVWRDYLNSVRQADANRKVHGRLVSVQDIDGTLLADGESYPLLPLTSMGRSPTNLIIVEDSFASGDHAVVALREGQWWLEDQQSRNGTMLNGTLITHPVVMTDGDVIGIGRKRFRLDLDRPTLRKRPTSASIE